MALKQYTFWYSETDTYKAGFMAANDDEAKELLAKVFDTGELSLDDLPDAWSKSKSIETEYAPETLVSYDD
jgi:hypothetical protein